MIRAYLIFVVAAGALSAMLGGALPNQRSDDAPIDLRQPASLPQASDTSSRRASEEGVVELPRSSDGHFYAEVEINGASIRALIDTGASGIALSREDARCAGLATSIGMPNVVGRGADGDVRGEFVKLDRVALGHRTAEDMEAIVLSGGEQSLLGQSFLSKFDSVKIEGERMTLR